MRLIIGMNANDQLTVSNIHNTTLKLWNLLIKPSLILQTIMTIHH